jgi:hypothetical protein
VGLVLALVLVAVLVVVGWRRLRRVRRDRAWAALEAGSAATALVVERYDEIDAHVRARECPCGGRLEPVGERTQQSEGRVLRVVRADCRRCEHEFQLWFDTSSLYH